MFLKRAFILLALLTAPLPAAAAGFYPMEGGNPRRENRSLNPTSITNPVKIQWAQAPTEDLGYPNHNPLILSDRVVQCFRYGIRCYDRATGSKIWTWICDTRTELYNAPCYDADRDRIYVGTYTGETLALDPATGAVLWQLPHRPSSYPWQYSSPLYAEGKLFVGNGGNQFVCLDPDTHAAVWTFDMIAYTGIDQPYAPCTPAYDNGFIYLSTVYGDLFCLKASDGAVQWHVVQNMVHVNCPLLSDEYIYTLGELGGAECRSRVDGSLVWSSPFTGKTNGNLALCGELLIVPGDSWRVWGVNRHTGDKVWCTTLTGNFARNTPFVVCGKVFISACHGDFFSLDGQTGNIEWRFRHGVELTFVGWAEADGQMFVADKLGRMMCFVPDVPGDPLACVCNLNATPQPTPTGTLTPVVTPNYYVPVYIPNWCSKTPTPSPTPPPITYSPTRTPTPTPTITFTRTVTRTPTPVCTLAYPQTYNNTSGAVAAALGVTAQIVDEARALNYDPQTTYIIILLTKHCGCHPGDLFNLLITMSWDEICATYGTDWTTLDTEAGTLTTGLASEGTPTPTSTPTDTPTFTPTDTPSETPSFTPSDTLTFTPTDTPTFTPTPTPSNTPTLTPTNSPTLTNSFTPTSTFTFTSTPSATPSATSTVSSTPSPTRTPEKTCNPIPHPNPCDGKSHVKFNCGGGPYEKIDVHIYTTGYRKIRHHQHVCKGQEEEDVDWDVKDDHGDELANGLYYAVIETSSHGNVKKYVRKCLILR